MGEDETIMVVEDDDATREFLADNLRADSFGVVTATTGREAFNLLQMEECDLLLLDVMLPDASGYELCRRLRDSDGLAQRVDPSLPVIMLSGRGSEADRMRGFSRGADDYVVKLLTSPICSAWPHGEPPSGDGWWGLLVAATIWQAVDNESYGTRHAAAGFAGSWVVIELLVGAWKSRRA